MSKNDLPTYEEFMNPLIQTVKALGGSATIEEMENYIGELMGLSDEQLELKHSEGGRKRTEVGYRLAWTRT